MEETVLSALAGQGGYALLLGAILATIWVNIAPASYYDTMERRLFPLPFPGWVPFGPRAAESWMSAVGVRSGDPPQRVRVAVSTPRYAQ